MPKTIIFIIYVVFNKMRTPINLVITLIKRVTQILNDSFMAGTMVLVLLVDSLVELR